MNETIKQQTIEWLKAHPLILLENSKEGSLYFVLCAVVNHLLEVSPETEFYTDQPVECNKAVLKHLMKGGCKLYKTSGNPTNTVSRLVNGYRMEQQTTANCFINYGFNSAGNITSFQVRRYGHTDFYCGVQALAAKNKLYGAGFIQVFPEYFEALEAGVDEYFKSVGTKDVAIAEAKVRQFTKMIKAMLKGIDGNFDITTKNNEIVISSQLKIVISSSPLKLRLANTLNEFSLTFSSDILNYDQTQLQECVVGRVKSIFTKIESLVQDLQTKDALNSSQLSLYRIYGGKHGN
jgi:hypothetical protein